MSNKIITEFVYPPIPTRAFDWSAHRDNFDADYDYERRYYVSKCPVGHGPTELDAIFDLLEREQEEAL